MGAFIKNCHVYDRALSDIANRLTKMSRFDFYLIDSGARWVTVFPCGPTNVFWVAEKLSDVLSTGVLATMVQDDDQLYYLLHEYGKEVDELNSNPFYYGEEAREESLFDPEDSPRKLLRYAPPGTTIDDIAVALDKAQEEYLASDGLKILGKALGIDPEIISFTAWYFLIGEIIAPGKEPILIKGKKEVF